jgi:TIR domain-containing protein
MVSQQKAAWDIFIAYSADDWQHAIALYELLSPHLSPFFDRRSLPEGADFDIAIPEAQRNARMTVVLVGTDYDRAYYVRTEVALAIALARANPERHSVVPIYIQGRPALQEVPYGLQLKQSFDFIQEGSWEAIATKLREILANENVTKTSGEQDSATIATDQVALECVKNISTAELRVNVGDVLHSEVVLENAKVGPIAPPPVRAVTDIKTGDIVGSRFTVKNVEQRKSRE